MSAEALLVEAFLDEAFRGFVDDAFFLVEVRPEAFFAPEPALALPDPRALPARAASWPLAEATAAPAFIAIAGALSATFFATTGAFAATVPATLRTAFVP